ncbi:helix-turn-helix transcriptional regulator [Yoonia sp.]|uniref:helix-turn-helix transcriptional regulator n=1 Tax=Yoonia sp. TaxID=2212373 RepID=UPI0039759860
MSYRKAQELLRLAGMCAARHRGVCLQDIVIAFEVNHRTAQRMVQALRDVFPSLAAHTYGDRQHWWKLRDITLISMQGIYDDELVALEMSARRAARDGAHAQAEVLQGLRERFVATLPAATARRAEVDAEAVLEAQGYACRPGPKVKTSPKVTSVIAAALKGPCRLTISYQGKHDPAPRERIVEPYGMLLGTRHYLVARDPHKDDQFRRFRMDRISTAEATPDWFVKDEGFDLETYAAQAFGSFHMDAEYSRVVWRFDPAAAVTAREFEFHPKQKMIDEDDGRLIVSFDASGLVEMAWHLYKWGDAVEVIEPPALRDLVAGWQNKRISVLP